MENNHQSVYVDQQEYTPNPSSGRMKTWGNYCGNHQKTK
jgi:hypothetical protein